MTSSRLHTEVRWLEGPPSEDAKTRVEALLATGDAKPSGTRVGDAFGVTRGPFSVLVTEQAGRTEIRVAAFARQRDLARAITIGLAMVTVPPAAMLLTSRFPDLQAAGWASIPIAAAIGATLAAWGRWQWKKRAVETRDLADRVALALDGERARPEPAALQVRVDEAPNATSHATSSEEDDAGEAPEERARSAPRA